MASARLMFILVALAALLFHLTLGASLGETKKKGKQNKANSGNGQGPILVSGQGQGQSPGQGQGAGTNKQGQGAGRTSPPGQNKGPSLVGVQGQGKTKDRSSRGQPTKPIKGKKGTKKPGEPGERPELPPGLTEKESRENRGMRKEKLEQISQNTRDIQILVAENNGYQLSEADLNDTDGFLFGDVAQTLSQTEFLKEYYTEEVEKKRKGKGENNGKAKGHSKRSKRGVIDDFASSTAKWDLPIYYYINQDQEGITDAKQEVIRNAMDTWQEETCVTFEPFYFWIVTDKVVNIRFNSTDGCWSYVGRVLDEDVEQVINIGDGCDTLAGIAAHEVAHLLGLWHEQSRPDRDNYVIIVEDNIQAQYLAQYDIYPDGVTHGVKYDYKSVMHYAGKSGFAIDTSLPAIKTIDELDQSKIGQRAAPTFHDVKIVNLEYCADECPTKLACEGEGYTDPKDCTKCRCPDDRSGQFCENLAVSRTGSCFPQQATITVENTDYNNTFRAHTSDYENFYDYQLGDFCVLELVAPEGCEIEMKVDTYFSLYDINGVCYHPLEIRYKEQDKGPEFCGAGVHWNNGNPFLTSTSNRVLVIFDATYTDEFLESFAYIPGGWLMQYKIADASCLSKETTTTGPNTTTITAETTTTETTTTAAATTTTETATTAAATTTTETATTAAATSTTETATTAAATTTTETATTAAATTTTETATTAAATTTTETATTAAATTSTAKETTTTTAPATQATTGPPTPPSDSDIKSCFIDQGKNSPPASFSCPSQAGKGNDECDNVFGYTDQVTCTFNGVESCWKAKYKQWCVYYVAKPFFQNGPFHMCSSDRVQGFDPTFVEYELCSVA